MMSDCLGLEILGSCAYNPSNPTHVYFSVGEAIAALSITLIIPQLIKRIYSFRLKCQFLSLNHVYYTVFAGIFFIIISALLPNVEIAERNLLTYPVFWELLGAGFYIVAFLILAYALLVPANMRTTHPERFAKAAADLLAHADESDRVDFSPDLLKNFDILVERSAFFDSFAFDNEDAVFVFRYRREIREASYAASLLELASESAFCETLVYKCPWDTAAMLLKISEKQETSSAAVDFVQEVARQAIISPNSMMGRELAYKGFRSVPVLSEALFSDYFINRRYEPLRGLALGNFSNITEETIDRLNYAAKSVLELILESKDYWQGGSSFNTVADCYALATAEARRRITADRNDYGCLVAANFGLRDVFKLTNDHFTNIDLPLSKSLYLKPGKRYDYTVLEGLSKMILEVLSIFGEGFRGPEDPFWSIALDIVRVVFSQDEKCMDGLNPFQQRVALKLIERVQYNIKGWYPPITGVLLSAMGPYRKAHQPADDSAYGIFERAFYCELQKFHTFYAEQTEKAKNCLPDHIRYEPISECLIHMYAGGQERPTRLSSLDIGPISLAAEDVGLDYLRTEERTE